MLQEKVLRYLDYCSGTSGKKCVGFFRMEVYEQTCDLEICIQGMRATDDFRRDVLLRGESFENGEEREYVFDQICFDKGQAVIRYRDVDKRSLFQSGVDSNHLWEICIPIASGAEIRCGVRQRTVRKRPLHTEAEGPAVSKPDEDGFEISEEPAEKIPENTVDRITIEENTVDRVTIEENETVPEQDENILPDTDSRIEMEETETFQATEIQEKTAAPLPRMLEEKWAQLASVYPKANPFRDQRTYLKLGLQDFVILPEKYYVMCKNSFLLHGYMNYGYILLAGFVKRGNFEYYLGVPGVFYEKERQVAKLYGFDYFEADRENAREGDFGIYFMKIFL